ncbi:ribosomal protein L1p/L10e family-domain-containing protein [Crepidotus variabilis]|uniref:Ribosomal L1 domain-containing protein 1 n=1 Tax=Crepidotus variabilis TaxID=179855 RepID=A0A9P6E4X4_9AGAR|nr:ribosomal protein L1p/L10e family-domain-containing protein [Crepidotus variabilis]
MPKNELIAEHVSLKQIKKAVDALHTHESKKKEKFEENQILPAKEQFVWLNVTVKTIDAGRTLKPRKIPIAHPLVDPRTTPVCLITKDPQREYKDLLESHNIKFISRVVGIEKLKGKFKPFEARRMLLKENGMFLADERITPLLPKLLGSKWFEAKKQPIPVCLTRKDLKGELERAISSTYMNQNQGTYTSIKIGKLSQSPAQIVDNIKTALPVIVSFMKGGWVNIQSFNIKTNSSVSLPIWACTLDDSENGRWLGLPAKEEEESAEEVEEDEAAQPLKYTGSKQKRQSNSDAEEEKAEKPRKKARTVGLSQISKNAVHGDSTPISGGKKTGQASSTTKPTEVKSTKSVATSSQDRKMKTSTSTTTPTASASPASKPLSQKKALPPQKSNTTASVKTKVTSKNSEISPRPTKTSKSNDVVSTKDRSLASALSTLDLKQKRASGMLEKKKQLVAKAKGGKSVKNVVLGKRVAQ